MVFKQPSSPSGMDKGDSMATPKPRRRVEIASSRTAQPHSKPLPAVVDDREMENDADDEDEENVAQMISPTAGTTALEMRIKELEAANAALVKDTDARIRRIQVASFHIYIS